MRTLHLFAGIGGGLLADLILGHTPVCAVEQDSYCCAVLRERRDEGWSPGLHVHEGDVRLWDPSEWSGRVDCIAAGFPCQDLSCAGRGAGISGSRSGLWTEIFRVVDIVKPQWIFLENVPAIRTRGGEVILRALQERGYRSRCGTLAAEDVGAPHRRERWWCLAVSDSAGLRRDESTTLIRSIDAGEDEGRMLEPSRVGFLADALRQRRQQITRSASSDESQDEGRAEEDDHEPTGSGEEVVDSNRRRGSARRSESQNREQGRHGTLGDGSEVPDDPLEQVGSAGFARIAESVENSQRTGWEPEGNAISREAPRWRASTIPKRPSWWTTEPDLGRVAHGIPARIHRLSGLGNAQVPLQAALAWVLLGGPVA